MKYFQIRIALLAFAIGLASVPFAGFLQAKWIESSVELPKVESGSPIFVRVCPELRKTRTKDTTINCERGGGSGSGGRTYDDAVYQLTVTKIAKKTAAKDR